jgi:hypothetical protein
MSPAAWNGSGQADRDQTATIAVRRRADRQIRGAHFFQHRSERSFEVRLKFDACLAGPVVSRNTSKAGLDPFACECNEVSGRVKASVQSAAVGVDSHEDSIAELEWRVRSDQMVDGAVITVA